MHDFALAACPLEAVASIWKSLGSVSPPRNPDAPIRNACLLETPSQKRFDRFIGSFIMMTFPFKSEAFHRYINGCKRIP
jgi:hypothetical protein